MKKNPKELLQQVSARIIYSALFFAAIALVSTNGLTDEKKLIKIFSLTSELYTVEHFGEMCITLIAISGGLCIYQRISSSFNIRIPAIDNIFESLIHEFHSNVIHFAGALTGVGVIATFAAYLTAENNKIIFFFLATILLFISFSVYGFISGSILNGNEKSTNPHHQANNNE